MLEVLPTEWNTLLLEAGCAAMKTRMLLNWLVGELKSNPDMPILFVTCRKIHADDTLATLKGYEGFDWETHGFKNYLDARSAGQSKTAYMKDEKRLVVSLQSLNRIDDLTHFKGGLVVIDEVRSAASIPGGVTLPHEMSTLNTSLYTLCAQAKYRVFMDADVSADGAVESLLRIIVPQFDLVHVQLTQAALSRTMSIAFSGGSSIGKQVHQDWLRLKLLTARASRQPMVDAAARLIQAWGRRYLKRDGAAANRSLKRALHIRISKMREGRAACPPVGRVLVVCGTPGLAQEAAELCDMLGITYRARPPPLASLTARHPFPPPFLTCFSSCVCACCLRRPLHRQDLGQRQAERLPRHDQVLAARRVRHHHHHDDRRSQRDSPLFMRLPLCSQG